MGFIGNWWQQRVEDARLRLDRDYRQRLILDMCDVFCEADMPQLLSDRIKTPTDRWISHEPPEDMMKHMDKLVEGVLVDGDGDSVAIVTFLPAYLELDEDERRAIFNAFNIYVHNLNVAWDRYKEEVENHHGYTSMFRLDVDDNGLPAVNFWLKR